MAKNKFVTEIEFDVIKELMKHYSNAEIANFGRAGLIERSDTTLKEIRKANNFGEYQARNAELKAIVTVNGATFEGTVTECLERLKEVKENRR